MVRCLLWKITCLYQIIKDYYRGSGNQQLRQVFEEIWKGKLTSNGVIWGRIILGFLVLLRQNFGSKVVASVPTCYKKINLWYLTFISQYLLQRKQLIKHSRPTPKYLLQWQRWTFWFWVAQKTSIQHSQYHNNPSSIALFFLCFWSSVH